MSDSVTRRAVLSDVNNSNPNQPLDRLFLFREDGSAIDPDEVGGNGTGDSTIRRTVRGINYKAKPGVTPQATFVRDEWDLDMTFDPEFQDAHLSSHSWGAYAAPSGLAGSNWFTRLRRMFGIPTDQAKNHGVSGGVAIEGVGSFPGDGQAARALQEFAVPMADAAAAVAGYKLARNLTPHTSLALTLIGFNEPAVALYKQATNWKLCFKDALRALFVAYRAGRRYDVNSPEITYNGGWTKNTDKTIGMGSGQAVVIPSGDFNLAYVSFKLPDDYDGKPFAIHYHMDNTRVWSWAMNVFVENVKVLDNHNVVPLAIARGFGAPASGDNVGGGISFPGCVRVKNVPASSAGQNIILEYVSGAGNAISFDGVTFETDAPVMALQIPRLPASVGQSEQMNIDRIDDVNALHREVIDEFPEHEIAYAEFPSDNPFYKESARCFIGMGNPHKSDEGQSEYTKYVRDNVRASPITEKSYKAALVPQV